MSQGQVTVLVASRDPKQAEIRKALLEQAGFHVLPVLDFSTIEDACAKGNVAGVVIGWSVPVDVKRRVWNAVRGSCGPKTPIVELIRGGKPELIPSQALFAQEWDERQFAETVRRILNPN